MIFTRLLSNLAPALTPALALWERRTVGPAVTEAEYAPASGHIYHK